MSLGAKTLFVDHTAQLGGAELSLLDLASHTPGCRVALFEDGPFVERLNHAGVDTSVISAASLKSVRRDTSVLSGISAARGVLQAVRAVARHGRDYDLLYANSQKAWVVASLASKLCRKPAVWHLRDMLTEEHFSKTNIRVVVGLANRFAKRVITNSVATKQSFIDAGGRPDLVKVIYNGIDTALFDSDRQASQADCQEMPIVACVGRLCPWKGQHVFLDALVQVPGIRGWVIGAALFGEDEYVHGLHQQAESLGITDRVEFLGFREDIPALLGQCDILAHTATAPEPFGRVLVEAMFAGAAVIATRGGGPSEIVKDGETGLLVRPGDSAALASAIDRLVANPHDMRRQAEAARVDANKRFALDTVVTQVHEQIEEIANSPIRAKTCRHFSSTGTTAS